MRRSWLNLERLSVNRKIKILILIFLSIFFIILKGEEAESQQQRCSVGATAVNFGNYDIFLNTPLDSTGSITVNCTANVPNATLTLSTSPNSGSFNPRKMKRSGGTDLLNYNIYIDASKTTVFGDGTGGTQTIRVHKPPGTPSKEPWSSQVTVYGRIPSGQDVSVGYYTDNLTLTVEP